MRGKGLLFICNGCEDDSIRCNGRGKQGKDALSVCAQGLCKDAKPTKHTQPFMGKGGSSAWMLK